MTVDLSRILLSLIINLKDRKLIWWSPVILLLIICKKNSTLDIFFDNEASLSVRLKLDKNSSCEDLRKIYWHHENDFLIR